MVLVIALRNIFTLGAILIYDIRKRMHLSKSRYDPTNSNISINYYTAIEIMERERKATSRFLYLKYGPCRVNKLLRSKQAINVVLRAIRNNFTNNRKTSRW